MEKKADVAALLAWNSAAIGAKKAPKLYMVPKITKPTVKATSTMTQARRESGRLASDGGWRADTFTAFHAGGRKRPSGAVSIRSPSQGQQSGSCCRSICLLFKSYWRLPVALAATGKVIPCEVEVFLWLP